LLIEAGHASNEVRILTGAGEKYMRVLERHGRRFLFEMDMGTPVVAPGDVNTSLTLSAGEVGATLLNVGNPQCAVFVDHFDFDWRAMGREIERHPHFPHRTNVSFVRVLNHESIDVRFFERGVGETNSSGTGSTGAMAAAVLRGLVGPQVLVQTPAGPLKLRWDKTILLEGPAELTAHGEFFLPTPGGF
jgi:diaminopimelate epimerase